MPLSHYDILGVSPTASPEVIKAAYHALMKQEHPDVTTAAGEHAARLNEAYDILSSPNKRAIYDADFQKVAGDLVGGKYRILGKIADGGFGTTYKAEHVELPGSFVCIKHAGKVSATHEAILKKEARAMWDLRHHAIPPVRDFLPMDDGSFALVIGFIEGTDLHDLVEQNGPLDPEDVAWIAERIINPLLYMHRHGVVHGDLKPKNVIIQPDSHEVALVDFGLAAVRPNGADGSIGFTPVFSPPEARKGLPLLPESDAYSLGATMLFALTGDLKAAEKRLSPKSVPVPLREYIRELMHTDPLQRPNWLAGPENPMEAFARIREQSFGRRRSGMKTLKHVS